jgi:carotenoid 1,2-hydratase
MLGNPFSPAYSRARARTPGATDPLPFSAMNVALYGRTAAAFSLFERPVTAAQRAPSSLTIGKSTMRWDDGHLRVDLDERTTPLGRPLRGTILLHPEAQPGHELAIDGRALHRWWPVAPLARLEVDLPVPGVRFTGHGYHDANAGEVPLEASFEHWTWSRARSEGRALLTYDVAETSGETRALAFEVSPRGDVAHVPSTWRSSLPRTTWGLDRDARADHGHEARVVRALEDGPFYARALVETRLGGRQVVAMHEALAADRLRRAWVRFFTRFRMRTE